MTVNFASSHISHGEYCQNANHVTAKSTSSRSHLPHAKHKSADEMRCRDPNAKMYRIGVGLLIASAVTTWGYVLANPY